jgi:hypothetical protein
MNAPNDHTGPRSFREWWADPPRSGLRRMIWPWEYRHARAFAQIRIAGAVVLVGLGVVTLSFGGADWAAYGWTMAWLALAAIQFAWAGWLLRIARSQTAGT